MANKGKNGEKLFTDLHDAVRATMLGFARVRGYEFTPGELEMVLWDHGLGHQQLELHSMEGKEAEAKMRQHLKDHPRTAEENNAISDDALVEMVRANVQMWRGLKDPKKRVDEHTAYLITHSAAV